MVAEAATPVRKQSRDARVTRARILAAAREEFVTHGLNGARVDQIAKTSGVNKNLIYHYFTSKDDLYLEVLETIYVGLRTNQKDEELRTAPPVEAMTRLVENTFDHFAATPELIRLMSIENIHYAAHLKRSLAVKPLYAGLLDTLQDILKRGQASGEFRPRVDAVELYLSISGLAYFFLSNQHTLSWLLDRDLTSPRRMAIRRRHVVEMVMGYLTNSPDTRTRNADDHSKGEKRR